MEDLIGKGRNELCDLGISPSNVLPFSLGESIWLCFLTPFGGGRKKKEGSIKLQNSLVQGMGKKGQVSLWESLSFRRISSHSGPKLGH